MSRKQCVKCPWRKDVDPHDIPDGYSIEKHRALARTITSGVVSLSGGALRIMACHETTKAACAGWIANQMGPGNNLALRIHASRGMIDVDVELVGDQHSTFDETLPG